MSRSSYSAFFNNGYRYNAAVGQHLQYPFIVYPSLTITVRILLLGESLWHRLSRQQLDLKRCFKIHTFFVLTEQIFKGFPYCNVVSTKADIFLLPYYLLDTVFIRYSFRFTFLLLILFDLLQGYVLLYLETASVTGSRTLIIPPSISEVYPRVFSDKILHSSRFLPSYHHYFCLHMHATLISSFLSISPLAMNLLLISALLT